MIVQLYWTDHFLQPARSGKVLIAEFFDSERSKNIGCQIAYQSCSLTWVYANIAKPKEN